MHMQSLKLWHQSLGGDAFTRKHMKIVAQYPLHHVTCAPAKFEGLDGDAFTRKYLI